MKVCPKCEIENREEARFCKGCGTLMSTVMSFQSKLALGLQFCLAIGVVFAIWVFLRPANTGKSSNAPVQAQAEAVASRAGAVAEPAAEISRQEVSEPLEIAPASETDEAPEQLEVAPAPEVARGLRVSNQTGMDLEFYANIPGKAPIPMGALIDGGNIFLPCIYDNVFLTFKGPGGYLKQVQRSFVTGSVSEVHHVVLSK